MKKKEKRIYTRKIQKQKEIQTPQYEPAHKTQRPLHHSKGTLAFASAEPKPLAS
jgi:hypothetical protein